MPLPTIEQLNNVELDAKHIADIATSTLLTAVDRKGNIKKTMVGAIASISAINNRGDWQPATSYSHRDIVYVSNTWYICVSIHVSSSTFIADAAKWRVYQGVVSSDLSNENGADLIGVGSRTVGDILRDDVDPFQFLNAGEITDVKTAAGILNVSYAIQQAFNTGKRVFLKDGVWLVNDSINTMGQSFYGPGVLKILKEPTIPTFVKADVTSENDATNIRMVFVESAWDLQDFLTIKSLGFNTVIHYGGWNNQKAGEEIGSWSKMLNSAKTVGISVLMGTEWSGANASTATAIGDYEGSPVIGYVMFDEPVPRAISKEDQEEKIASFRLVTDKPLGVTESGQRGIVNDDMPDEYDFCFVHIYPDAVLNTVDTVKPLALQGLAETGVKMPTAKLIPTVGLITMGAASPDLMVEFAQQYVRCGDSSYGAFVWDGYGDAGILSSVRRSAKYRKCCLSLKNIVKVKGMYKIEVYAWGGDVRNLPLGDIKKVYAKDDSTPGCQPFSVVNVGSYVDSRHATFNRRAISFPGLGGTFATNINSKGYVAFRGYAGNSETPAVMTCSILSTPSDWYEVVNHATATNLVNFDIKGFTLNAYIPARSLIALDMSFTTAPVRDPWRFLGGVLVNSNWLD